MLESDGHWAIGRRFTRKVNCCTQLVFRVEKKNRHFGFVVGIPDGGDFRIDPIEVERTLDLFPPLDGS